LGGDDDFGKLLGSLVCDDTLLGDRLAKDSTKLGEPGGVMTCTTLSSATLCFDRGSFLLEGEKPLVSVEPVLAREGGEEIADLGEERWERGDEVGEGEVLLELGLCFGGGEG
jgi:hypothetical protein